MAEFDTSKRKTTATDAVDLQSYLDRSSALEDADDIERGLDVAVLGAELAEAAGDIDMFVALRVQQARLSGHGGGFAQAVETLAKTVPYVDRCRDKARAVDFLSSYAVNLAIYGDVGTATAHLQRASTLAETCDAETRMLVKLRSCEVLLTIGPSEQLIEDAETAFELFATLPPGNKTHFRYAYVRALIARVVIRLIASRAGTYMPPQDQLERILSMLEEADACAREHIPIMNREIEILRGFFYRVTGGDVHAVRERILRCDWFHTLQSGDPTQRDMSAWALYEAETGGDLELARFLLDQTEPASRPDVLTIWEREWTTARAALHQAEGDPAAACATYRHQIRLEMLSRQRYFAVLTDIGRQVAETEELKRRERRAAAKAARLTQANAALAAEKARLSEAVYKDPLTGLGNRRLLQERLATLESGPAREQYSLLVLDVDHFKSVNDRFSHQVGDKVLAAVGRILAGCFRQDDDCVRYGGEEFLVLMKGVPSFKRLERVLLAVQDFDWGAVAQGLAVTASIGAVAWEDGIPFADALARADARLYMAKHLGRNRVVMHDRPALKIA